MPGESTRGSIGAQRRAEEAAFIADDALRLLRVAEVAGDHRASVGLNSNSAQVSGFECLGDPADERKLLLVQGMSSRPDGVPLALGVHPLSLISGQPLHLGKLGQGSDQGCVLRLTPFMIEASQALEVSQLVLLSTQRDGFSADMERIISVGVNRYLRVRDAFDICKVSPYAEALNVVFQCRQVIGVAY